MWLVTPLGFYSVVRKDGDVHLTIRARIAADLDRLRDLYLPELSSTTTGGGTDYPFRAKAPGDAWARALSKMGRDINYANFKDEVARVAGHERAHVYGRVWSALMALEKLPPGQSPIRMAEANEGTLPATGWSPDGPLVHPTLDDDGNPVVIEHPSTPSGPDSWKHSKSIALVVPAGTAPDDLNRTPELLNGTHFRRWSNPPQSDRDWEALAGSSSIQADPPMKSVPGKHLAAGVVAVEPDGRVWIVAPTNAFGGYRFTFPKGRPSKGTSLRAAAIREAYEETGLRVELISHLLDSVRSTTVTRYFLAKRTGGDPTAMGWEAQAVALAPIAELKKLLNVGHDNEIVDRLVELRQNHPL